MNSAHLRNVSVVIPTFNGERFIRESLESVFAQTLLSREVIVVDDCSTDGTTALVKGFARMCSIPIKLLELKHNSGGPARPMNIGIAAATGHFVVLLDQDDLMSARKIEQHVAAFDSQDSVGLVFGQMDILPPSGRVLPDRAERFAQVEKAAQAENLAGCRLLGAAAAFRLLVQDGYNYGGAGGTSIRRDVWAALGGFDESLRIAWDFDFALRVAHRGYNVAYCNCAAFTHRQHDANLENADSGLLLARERVAVFEKLLQLTFASPADREAVARQHTAELDCLIWMLRRAGRIKEALGALRQRMISRGICPRLLVEFVKTTAAGVGLVRRDQAFRDTVGVPGTNG